MFLHLPARGLHTRFCKNTTIIHNPQINFIKTCHFKPKFNNLAPFSSLLVHFYAKKFRNDK